MAMVIQMAKMEHTDDRPFLTAEAAASPGFRVKRVSWVMVFPWRRAAIWVAAWSAIVACAVYLILQIVA